ncbi:MAG: DNA modification methylase [Kiritimatiellia bacterium]
MKRTPRKPGPPRADETATANAAAPISERRHRLKIEYVDPATLAPYENNPRDNDDAVEGVAASIGAFGFIDPIIVGPDGTMLAGHTRLKSAIMLQEAEVPIIRVDYLTPEEARAFRLADNKVAERAKWIDELLAAEADLLKDSGIDLAAFGFDTSALADLLTDESPVDAAPDAETTVPRTEVGDLWDLGGKHRLIVGDSTDPAVIGRLMDGATADCWLTDPPYNVDYHGNAGSIANDNMGDAQFLAFLTAAFRTAADALKPGGAGYIWHADSEGLNFRTAVRDSGLETVQCLIWKKNALVLGRQDYQWIHEPALYVRKPGAKHYFTSDRTQTTVMEEPPLNLDTMGADDLRALLRRVLAIKTVSVLNFPKPRKNADHPTEKPVELFTQLVKNSTRRGEIVLDTFAGSGTTVLACEKCGRLARVCELDPKYATVILDRWEAETGLKAVKVEAGENAR